MELPAGCHAGHVGALPTGVVSFVLTDVVGSTELWERAPDAMAVALARHEELVTAAVDGAGGTVLKPRGEGDSTFSVFTRATDALRAAHRLQVAVRAEEWPAAAVIRIRAAVHTGEAVERDGDYFGPAVNRVARLRGAAHGGEVVVSAATAAIVSGALPAGWDLVDIGTVELRGLGPQSAFLLAAPDLDPIRRRRPTRRTEVSRGGRPRCSTWSWRAGRTPRSPPVVHLGAHRRVARVVTAPQARRVRPARPRPARPCSAGTRRLRCATALLPPALELLADPAGFVGRVAERDAAPRSMAARGGRAHPARGGGRRGGDGEEPPRRRAGGRRARRRWTGAVRCVLRGRGAAVWAVRPGHRRCGRRRGGRRARRGGVGRSPAPPVRPHRRSDDLAAPAAVIDGIRQLARRPSRRRRRPCS